MDNVSRALLMVGGLNEPPIAPGQQAYTTAGTYTWIAPAGVTKVSVVCVGAGGAGSGYPMQGSGAGLGWRNNITVTPGAGYTVVVGQVSDFQFAATTSGASSFLNSSTVSGNGGSNLANFGSTPSPGGTFVGDGGGNGGNSLNGGNYAGGGGAGGYTGNGGVGSAASAAPSAGGNGSGGGGGGGSGAKNISGGGIGGGQGGGVGLLGQGANGSGGPAQTAVDGNGLSGTAGSGGSGRTHGGGSSADSNKIGAGAVRIIWGTGRSFPSTNTGDL